LGETKYSYSTTSFLSCEHWQKPRIFPYLLRRRSQNILRMLTTRIRAGDRCPPHFLSPVDPNFFSRTTGFKAIIFEGLPGSTDAHYLKNLSQCTEFGQNLLKIQKGIISDVLIVANSERKIYKKFGVYGQCIFLIRPDGYVGFRCEPLDMEQIIGYLKTRVGVKRINFYNQQDFKPLYHDWIPFALFTGLLGIIVGLTYHLKN